MKDVGGVTAEERSKNNLLFYFIIVGLITSFLVTELLVEEFVLHRYLSFFEHTIAVSILYVLITGITFFFAGTTKVSNSEMGFHFSYVPRSIAIGLLATSGFLVAVAAFQLPLNYTSLVEIVIILCFTLLIGLTEEAAFRGYIQANYMKIMPQMKAILITGILFAVLHVPSYIISGNIMNVISLPSLILVGLILGFIRVRTGNLWGVIIAHATWDFYIFLFSPTLTVDAEIMELATVLVASGAMWGTIVLAMFVAKWWIDHRMLIDRYSMDIENLTTHIFKLQQITNAIRMSGFPRSYVLIRYSNQIKMEEEWIEIYREYLPQINEINYKTIQKLIPLKNKLVKIDQQLSTGGPPWRLAKLEMKKAVLGSEIQVLEKELENIKYYKIQ
ncbi:MAG: CPBP family intramembrane metalloprotease [Candidatus Helarchaeota archaeon]|nr:CPBP family intramembrane metalloprotease [Candidatus Helarchaeota archaeon]